jgi:hypothetical protein
MLSSVRRPQVEDKTAEAVHLDVDQHACASALLEIAQGLGLFDRTPKERYDLLRVFRFLNGPTSKRLYASPFV